MKKLLYLIILSFAIFSCEKEEMVEYLNTNEASDIKEIKLYANSSQLFADGKSSLSFLYDAIGEVQVVEYIALDTEGTYKDTLVTETFTFKEGRLPEGSVKIYTEDGTEVTGDFFTTQSTADSIKFYAEGGGVRSELVAVDLQPAPTESYEQITIPVIFHLVSNSGNKHAVKNVTSEFLEEKIDRMNKVFAGTLFPSPHSIDAKVKFELVEHDKDGIFLEEKGIHRINAGDATQFDLTNFINGHIWDPSKYLNVYISDWYYERWGFAYSVEFESIPPNYITTDPSALPFPNKIQAAREYRYHASAQVDSMDVPYESAADVGVIISTDALFDQSNQYSFEYFFGPFFGILPTNWRSGYSTPLKEGDIDFCSDTYLHRIVFLVRRKNLVEPNSPTSTSASFIEPRYAYESYNVMDEYSSSTTLTYEQVKRIRTVLEYCPHRQFRK